MVALIIPYQYFINLGALFEVEIGGRYFPVSEDSAYDTLKGSNLLLSLANFYCITMRGDVGSE